MAELPTSRIHPSLYILLGVLAVLSFFIVAPLWPFILGGLLVGYLGYPVFRWLHKHIPHRAVAASLALIILILAVIVPMGYIGYELVLQTQGLAQQVTVDEVQGMAESAGNLTREYFGWPQVSENQTVADAVIEEVVPRARGAVLGWLPNAPIFLAQFGLGVTVVLFIGYYALRDGDRFIDFIEDLLPLQRSTEQRIIDEMANSLDAVVFGQVATAAIQGALMGVGFWVFGVPAPVLWGFVTAVLSLLPVVGAPIVWLPAGIILIVTGSTGSGIGVLLWGAVLVSTIDNVIKPKIMAERSGMHPTLALLGAIGGLIAFGFMGFLVGPLVLAMLMTFIRIYLEQRQELEIQHAREVDEILSQLASMRMEAPSGQSQGEGGEPGDGDRRSERSSGEG